MLGSCCREGGVTSVHCVQFVFDLLALFGWSALNELLGSLFDSLYSWFVVDDVIFKQLGLEKVISIVYKSVQ